MSSLTTDTCIYCDSTAPVYLQSSCCQLCYYKSTKCSICDREITYGSIYAYHKCIDCHYNGLKTRGEIAEEEWHELNKDRSRQQDKFWKNICAEMGWEFQPASY